MSAHKNGEKPIACYLGSTVRLVGPTVHKPFLPFLFLQFRVAVIAYILRISWIIYVISRCIYDEEMAEEEVGQSIADYDCNDRLDQKSKEVVETSNVSQQSEAVVCYALLLRSRRLQPHFYRKHRLFSVHVLLPITIPVLSSHHVFMLHSRLWVREHFGLWQEDLVVRVLNLNVYLLDDSFHALMILKI